MHAVVGRRQIFDEHPGLARGVYDSYLAAKETAAAAYREHNRLFEVHTMLPWTNSLFERNQRLFGHDWWPTASPPTVTHSTPTCATTMNKV